ncbi:UDP-glucose 4-epimerase GalE [Halopseudomonas pelagia]|uniref:UDP-glucose 4-epimerase n=1 Tax=Halopseudomonas pelagia TaxID=553151 RepID=A0AA92IJG5_9GAMM|nr:UDP-glucose 4-epimerase GalE [Halopseudomonas pelagia]PCC98404.1 UDP-glucose 4-epimerase GalE [Halopseudomonas pelagia]QFY57677.1 UDP-glucose 4-epimerase GalE [Halopseudomonas pelagia]
MSQTILVTGGAGFIGTHTCIKLVESGFAVLVLDNFSNSSPESLKRAEYITGKSIPFIEGDINDARLLDEIFAQHSIDVVIHFAGLKAVGESVQQPLRYYQNNVSGTLVLCDAMQRVGVKNLVFSSSATVYGDPASLPVRESSPTSATNPYGRSKLMIEELLADLHRADPEWNIALLRYFNPVGAHPSGRIGEDPGGIPNNLMPFIAQVAVGRREHLTVFGGDYPTPDGTGVRDYIHVMDLAAGHVQALRWLEHRRGIKAFNLGTGRGYSVLDMLKAFERACGKSLPYQLAERRPGDVASCYADPQLAADELNWKAELGIQAMCEDAWRWQSENPNGY